MLRRLKLLKRLQEVPLNPEEGLALIQRVESHSESTEDRDLLIQVIRATQAAQQLVAASPPPGQPAPGRKAKRQRQWTKAARRRNRR